MLASCVCSEWAPFWRRRVRRPIEEEEDKVREVESQIMQHIRGPWRAVAFAVVASLVATTTWTQGSDDPFARYGIQPASDVRPAAGFDLPNLDGRRISLSDYQGRWVLLTFFATWCGPCRSEMPSLEQVHRRWSDSVAVVGVSMDSQSSVVGPFLRSLGITFDVVWDERTEVARVYRANSVPISYLVDPSGRLVGRAQGARDWSRMDGLFEALTGTVASTPASPKVQSASDEVEMEAVSEPPTAEVAVSDSSPVVGEVFHLDVRMHWAGAMTEYVPQPPKVLLPDGVERVKVTASTSTIEGRNVVSYRIALRAVDVGEFALDPVELRYIPRSGPAPVTTTLEGPTVLVQQRKRLGLSVVTAGVLGFSILCVVAGVSFALRRSKRRESPVDPDPEAEHRRLLERFDAARSQRIQGDTAGFVEAMAAILSDLGDGSPDRIAEFDNVIERVRYGGETPPPEELDRLQRNVQRRLQGLSGDPDQREREAVRLAEEGE